MDQAEAIQTAAYNRQLPIVKYLLELGADTEAADVGTRSVAADECLQDPEANALRLANLLT